VLRQQRLRAERSLTAEECARHCPTGALVFEEKTAAATER